MAADNAVLTVAPVPFLPALWRLRADGGDARLCGRERGQQRGAHGSPRPDRGGPGATPRQAGLVLGAHHGPLAGPGGGRALFHPVHRPLPLLHGDGGALQPQR